MIKTKDGLTLHSMEWTVKNPKAELILVHGYAEYAGRYDHFAKFLNEQFINVYAFDHRGHGESEGETAYVADGQLLVEDLELFIGTRGTSSLPTFIFGHSMGGLVSAAYFLSKYKDAHDIQGLIMSAPGLMPSREISPLLVKLSGFLGRFFPRLKTIQLDPSTISSDPKEVEKYVNDPLVYSGKWIARTGAELVKMMRSVQANAATISIPYFLGHGDADKLAEIEGSRQFFINSGSKDKTFKTYEGFYHELVNEPGKEEFMNDVLEWINKRV